METGQIGKEEELEYYLLDGNVVDRKIANTIGDAEAVKKREKASQERARFVNVVDALLNTKKPNQFDEMDKVRLKVEVEGVRKGAEGLVTEVFPPSLTRYRIDKKLVFSYEVVIHLFDRDTLRVFGSVRVRVGAHLGLHHRPAAGSQGG